MANNSTQQVNESWGFYDDSKAQLNSLDTFEGRLFAVPSTEKDLIQVETCFVTSSGECCNGFRKDN